MSDSNLNTPAACDFLLGTNTKRTHKRFTYISFTKRGPRAVVEGGNTTQNLLAMEGEETLKETRPRSVAMVDEKISKDRIEKLGAALDEIWPKDKSEFKTTVSTACVVDTYYRDSLPSGSPVQLMIVSESPCHTRGDLPEMQLNLNALKEAGIDGYDGPLSHMNLVHCLTYGESWAIKEESKAASTQDKMKQVGTGTWKFWKVLATLAGMADVRNSGDDPLATSDTVKDAI
jgi:hypothetical protein